MINIEISDLKLLITRVLVILVPSYLAACLTDKMVYVVPTVAATALVAAAMPGLQSVSRRTDDDDSDADTDLESHHDTTHEFDGDA